MNTKVKKIQEQKDTSRFQSVKPWNKEISQLPVDQFDFLEHRREQEQKHDQ